MLELKDYQIQAVRDLKAKIKKQLNLQVRRKNIILKAPTGWKDRDSLSAA